MTEIKAEVITRINNNVWIRLLMNGGCDLIENNAEPKYDNQVKAILTSAEGLLDLSLTENCFEDSNQNFIKASVNFRNRDNNLVVRVDNNQGRPFHYNVKENGNIIKDHEEITCTEDEIKIPLKFALNEVIEYFTDNYSNLIGDWRTFKIPSLIFLSNMLAFGINIEGILNFPITFVAYPRSVITMQIYSKKATELRLIPTGFVIEKRDNI